MRWSTTAAVVAVVVAVDDEDVVQCWRWGGRSMADTAFDGDGHGGYGYKDGN